VAEPLFGDSLSPPGSLGCGVELDINNFIDLVAERGAALPAIRRRPKAPPFHRLGQAVLRRRIAASPTNPTPSNERVIGSGTEGTSIP
jgi:hypothetical protein